MTMTQVLKSSTLATNYPQNRVFLRDIVEGLNFLHLDAWIHGYIKPENIGISNNRAVILVLDNVMEKNIARNVRITSGVGGTINYLALEREM